MRSLLLSWCAIADWMGSGSPQQVRKRFREALKFDDHLFELGDASFKSGDMRLRCGLRLNVGLAKLRAHIGARSTKCLANFVAETIIICEDCGLGCYSILVANGISGT